MKLRTKVVVFTFGIVAALTGLSLMVIQRQLDRQIHEDLALQLRRTQSVFETFMANRAAWLRSQCLVIAEDPRFSATLDIVAPDPAYHERTVAREAARFQHIIGSDLFAAYGRDGSTLCRLTVMSGGRPEAAGLPTLAAALAGRADSQRWEREQSPALYVASVPLLQGDGSIGGTFTVGYREPIDSESLIADMADVAIGRRFAEILERPREVSLVAREMLKAFACDFVALTDNAGSVVGLSHRSSAPGDRAGIANPQVEAALRGVETSGIREIDGQLAQICVVPVWSGKDIVGVLETGFRIDREVALGLQDLMQTEVSFLLNDRVLVSTWAGDARNEVSVGLAASSRPDVFEMSVGNELFLSMIRSIDGPDGGEYLIQLSLDEAGAFLSHINRSLLYAGGSVMMLAGLISIVGATRIVRPIEALSEATRDLATRGKVSRIPVRSHDEVGDLASSFNDMSEALEQSRSALESSERLYRDLFESAQDVVYTTDLEMRLTSMNQAGQQLFGLEDDEIVGTSLYDLVESEDAERMREAERLVPPGGHRPAVEFQVRGRDDTLVSLEVTTRWLFNNETPVGVHGIARDITARREREEATSRFREQLHQAEKLRALGEMAAGVAHNFNNLLTGVLGYAEVMKMKGDVPDHIAKSADKIVESGKRCAAVIRRIQTFGRPLAVSERHAVAIEQVIKDAIDITRPKWETAPAKEGRDISVVIEAGGVGTIQGSEAVWEEILSNLIFNAVDAMPDGGTITIRTAREGDTVTVSVTDTGVGMDAETQRRVFEPFFTTKGPEDGTGLGLSTVWSLARAQDGQVNIDSEPGRGTTVSVAVSPSASVSETAESRVDLPGGLQILAVDDEPAVRELIPALLDDQEVGVADSGAAALEILQSRRCDVVMTDWVMAGMSGVDLAERIKDRWPDTRVLLMTGWEFDQASVPGAGSVDGVLAKPFDSDKIRSALSRMLAEPQKDATS